MRRAALLASVLALTGCAPAQAADTPPVVRTIAVPTTCPDVIAHRGAGAGLPSGSRAAFPAALKAGADGLEFDVRFTRDGVPVVYHDSRIDSGTNGTGRISAHTYRQLMRYRLDHVSVGQRYIPTLRQVLHDTGSARLLIIELKTRPTASQLRAFLGALDTHRPSRVVVESFSADTLRMVAAARPHLRRGLISWTAVPPKTVRASGTVFIPNAKAITPAYVTALRDAGVTDVYPWTVNSLPGWRQMATAGVDATMTDRTRAYLTGCRWLRRSP